MMYWPVAEEISFIDISIFSSGGHVVPEGELNILIMRDISVKLFESESVLQEDRSFKDISYL